jgi:hypothetical protein
VARAKKDVHKILQQEMDLWEQRMFALWKSFRKVMLELYPENMAIPVSNILRNTLQPVA